MGQCLIRFRDTNDFADKIFRFALVRISELSANIKREIAITRSVEMLKL